MTAHKEVRHVLALLAALTALFSAMSPAQACTECQCFIRGFPEDPLDACSGKDEKRPGVVVKQWTGKGTPSADKNNVGWKLVGVICDGHRGPRGPGTRVIIGEPDAGAQLRPSPERSPEPTSRPSMGLRFLLQGVWAQATATPGAHCSPNQIAVQFTTEYDDGPPAAPHIACIPNGANAVSREAFIEVLHKIQELPTDHDTLPPASASNGNEATTIARPGDESFLRARQSLIGGVEGLFGGSAGIRPLRLVQALADRREGTPQDWNDLLFDAFEVSGAIRQLGTQTKQTVSVTTDVFGSPVSPFRACMDKRLKEDETVFDKNDAMFDVVRACRRESDPGVVGGIGGALTNQGTDTGGKAWAAVDLRFAGGAAALTPLAGISTGRLTDFLDRDSPAPRFMAGVKATYALRSTLLRGLEGGSVEIESSHQAIENVGGRTVDLRSGAAINIALRGGLELVGGVRVVALGGFSDSEFVPTFSVGWADAATGERRPAVELLGAEAAKLLAKECESAAERVAAACSNAIAGCADSLSRQLGQACQRPGAPTGAAAIERLQTIHQVLSLGTTQFGKMPLTAPPIAPPATRPPDPSK